MQDDRWYETTCVLQQQEQQQQQQQRVIDPCFHSHDGLRETKKRFGLQHMYYMRAHDKKNILEHVFVTLAILNNVQRELQR